MRGKATNCGRWSQLNTHKRLNLLLYQGNEQRQRSVKQSVRQTGSKSCCVEWLGSQGDFIAGKAEEAISLERFDAFESLYAVGPLEQTRREVSIYESVPLVSGVQSGQVNITVDSYRHAAFLVYAIVENWRRVTVRNPVKTEQQLEEQLLA